MFKLRPYQKDCLTRILAGVKEGKRLQVIVLATGLGKTVIFAQLPTIVKKSGKKTLVLAHREELLYQAKEKILKYFNNKKENVNYLNMIFNKSDILRKQMHDKLTTKKLDKELYDNIDEVIDKPQNEYIKI